MLDILAALVEDIGSRCKAFGHAGQRGLDLG